MSKLICVRGNNKGDQFPLHEGKNIIGRSRDVNVVLFDKQSSRQQCVIYKRGRHCSVQDLESRNGTYLNKKKIVGKPKSLRPGDKIKIGKTVLLLSEKGVGGLIDQTAADVAADLQGKKFGRLMDRATHDVVHQHNHDAVEETGNSITRFFRKLFRK